jgi:rhodanese-related sulfurtransferase
MKKYFLIVCCILFIANAYSQTIKEVKASDAFEIVTNRNLESTIMIDGRSAEMFAEKHIEGAINIDAFQDFLTTELENYLKVNEIIVYCTNSRRAELIIENLKEMHYNGKITFISDGLNAWITAGFGTVNS